MILNTAQNEQKGRDDHFIHLLVCGLQILSWKKCSSGMARRDI
jgi:hypothetical protein